MNNKIRIPIILLIIIIVIGGLRYFLPPNNAIINNKDYINKKIDFDYTSLKHDNKASVIMNLDSNQVVYQNNMDQPLPVYSVSKIMFLATVSKQMNINQIKPSKKIKVPKLIGKVNKEANFSTANLKTGEIYTIGELFDAVMIPSGNDAAILLAYAVFGSHERAVAQMNENAKEWGMSKSSFVSSSGLDGKYINKIGIKAEEGRNLMSAYDSLVLLQRISKDYPAIIKSGSKSVSYIGKYNSKSNKLVNVNEVIEGLDYGYDGVYGLKTGSNMDDYSNNIIALKKDKNNQNIATISFNSKTRKTLYQDIAYLYNYLSRLEQVNLQDQIKLNTRVGFANNDVGFSLKRPYYLYVPQGQTFEYTIVDKSKQYNRYLNTFYGVKKDDVVGKIEFSNNEEFFGGKATNVGDVIVKDEVEKKGILGSISEFIVTLIKK